MIQEQSFDQELEKKIINSLFHDTHTADKILKKINPADFYFNNYKSVYAIVKEMRGRNFDIRPDTVYSYCLTKPSSLKAEQAKDIMTDFLMKETGIPYQTLDTDIHNLRELSIMRKIKSLENPTIEEINKIADMKKIEIDNPFITVNEILDQISNNEEIKKYSTGIRRIDGNYKFIKGQMTVISGIPNHGKSEFMDQVLINTIINYNFKWLSFSAENYPLVNYMKRKLIPKMAEDKFFNLDEKTINSCAEEIMTHMKLIRPEIENNKLDNILDLLNDDFDGLIIDPWNELYHNFEEMKMTETRYIEHSLTKLRNIARARNIAIFLIVHPVKQIKIPIDKNNKLLTYYSIPRPYDIMGSANWYNKADNILIVYKPAEVIENQVVPRKNSELHVSKIRNKELGSPGIVPLNYDFETGIIT